MRFKRKNTFPRRRFIKKRSSPKRFYKRSYPVRKALVSLAKSVKKVQKDVEVKVSAFTQDSYSGTAGITGLAYGSPQFGLISGLERGNDQNKRIGDQIRITSIRMEGLIYPTTASDNGGVNCEVRIMLVQMKKPRGQTMLLTQSGNVTGQTALFANASGTPEVYQKMDWGRLSNAWHQYKILYDKVYKLQTKTSWYDGSHAQNVNPEIRFNIVVPCSIRADYQRGNAGDITDIEENAIFLVYLTDTTSYLSVQYDSRMYFKDA